MKVASRVMYTIANFFTWIEVVFYILSIIMVPLMMGGMVRNDTGLGNADLMRGLIAFSIALFFSIVLIMCARVAKTRGSSKAWDFLFIILGILGGNIFYVLGGIFGLFAWE